MMISAQVQRMKANKWQFLWPKTREKALLQDNPIDIKATTKINTWQKTLFYS